MSKDSDIVRAIINNVAPRCGCAFTEDQISERSFQCFLSTPRAITYRARLRGTTGATVADLIRYIEEWVQEGNYFSLLTVDTSCSVGIDSLNVGLVVRLLDLPLIIELPVTLLHLLVVVLE